MNMQEVHATLSARFGEAIGPWAAPEHGDASIPVAAAALRDVALFLRDDPAMAFDFLRCVSSVDRKEVLSSVYHLYSLEHGTAVTLRVDVDRAAPRVATVSDIWPAADWHEREAYDMMGIEYEGHPELRRILLPADWEGFPLRKDYVVPTEYHGLTNE